MEKGEGSVKRQGQSLRGRMVATASRSHELRRVNKACHTSRERASSHGWARCAGSLRSGHVWSKDDKGAARKRHGERVMRANHVPTVEVRKLGAMMLCVCSDESSRRDLRPGVRIVSAWQ